MSRPPTVPMTSCKACRGFTLIELLIVIAIIGILAALLLPNLLVTGERARILATESLLTTLCAPLDEYRQRTGAYPADNPAMDTTTLVVELGPARTGLMNFDDSQIADFGNGPELIDGWRTAFRYQVWFGKGTAAKDAGGAHNRNSYDLWSAGPDWAFDALPGGPADDDNYTNWSRQLSP